MPALGQSILRPLLPLGTHVWHVTLLLLPQKNPTVVHVDNTGAFHILRNPVLNSRSKYFDVKLFKLREWVSDGIISPQRVSTKENVSDIFTKALTKPLFEKFLPRVLNLT